MGKILEKIKNFFSKFICGAKKEKESKPQQEELKPEKKSEEQK